MRKAFKRPISILLAVLLVLTALPMSIFTTSASSTETTVTITFYANGGTGGTSSSLQPGAALTAPVVTKEGCTFARWSPSVPATVPAANTTYMALWNANSYTVTFDANGGTGSALPVTQKYGTEVILPTSGFEKPGYVFKGWSSLANSDGTIGDYSMPAHDAVLYAVYSKLVTVSFDAQGGSVSPATAIFMYSDTYEALPTPTRSDYTFMGWYTNPGGSGTKVSAGKIVTVTQDQTLYAYWIPLTTVTVTFDAQGGSVSPAAKTLTTGLVYGSLPIPAKAGYTFLGWYTSPGSSGTQIFQGTKVAVTSDQTLYAKWVVTKYTVSFNCGSSFDFGMGPPSYTCFAGTIINPDELGLIPDQQTFGSPGHPPERDGYDFMGWAFSSAPATAVRSFTMPESDVTLYAIWEGRPHTITFDANGGEGGTSGPLQAGTPLTPPVVTRTGYTFAGWLPWAPEKVPAEDTTYTALWSVNSYTITFNANGGTGSISTSMAYGDPLAAPTVTRAGYIYTGWSPTVPATVPTGDATYTAQWRLNINPPNFLFSPGRTGTSVTLTWNAVMNARSYNVYCGGQKVNELSLSLPGYTVTGLTPGTAYSFTVTSVNGDAESAPGKALSVTTLSDAQDKVRFVVGSNMGFAGDTVTISAAVSENSNITAATFELPFDPGLLEVVSAVKGAALAGGTATVIVDTATHKIILTYTGAEPLATGGSVLDAQFKIKANTPAQTIYTGFSVTDLKDINSQDLPYTVTQGEIGVRGLLGDINIDGRVTVVDALLVLRYVTFMQVPENNIYYFAADVDRSGIINLLDALRILQYATGIRTSF